jgi:hypothetical protein
MTQPAKSQEPSMEEILASIRRIIADDDASKPAPAQAEPPPAAAAPPPLPSLRAAAPPRPQPVPPPAAAAESSAALGKGPLFGAAAAAAPSGRAGGSDQSADILDLTESMAAPPPGPPQFRTIDGNFDVGYEETVEKPTSQHRLSDSRPDGSQLMSRAATTAVDSAFNALAQTVLVQNARTLEDLVREMLRPLLKSWLDDNLPGMVERMVRSEIERVSRGRPG